MLHPLPCIPLKITLPNSTVIFNGYFIVNTDAQLAVAFYDTSDSSTIVTDILAIQYGSNHQPDFSYNNWAGLCYRGMNITSMPYLYGDTLGDYCLYDDTTTNGYVYISDAYSLPIVYSIVPIVSIPEVTGVIAPATAGMYSIQITLTDATPVFNGYFTTNTGINMCTGLYDTTDINTIGVNILSTGTTNSPDYVYSAGWQSFDAAGVNITSLPYFYGTTAGDYTLTGTSVTTAGSTFATPIVYSITPISVIPEYTAVIPSAALLYTFSVSLPSTATIFNGYFLTDSVTNIVHSFVDTSYMGVNILLTGSWSTPDNLFQPTWGSFDASGVNLTSFHYYRMAIIILRGQATRIHQDLSLHNLVQFC